MTAQGQDVTASCKSSAIRYSLSTGCSSGIVGFLATKARALAMLLVLGAITAVSAATGALGGGSGTWWWTVGGVLLSLLLNWALFLLIFRVLTVTSLSWSDVLPGALVAGTAWTILQALGGLYVHHETQASTGTYGTFAIVIGLLAWIYLGAQSLCSRPSSTWSGRSGSGRGASPTGRRPQRTSWSCVGWRRSRNAGRANRCTPRCRTRPRTRPPIDRPVVM